MESIASLIRRVQLCHAAFIGASKGHAFRIRELIHDQCPEGNADAIRSSNAFVTGCSLAYFDARDKLLDAVKSAPTLRHEDVSSTDAAWEGIPFYAVSVVFDPPGRCAL